MDVILAIKNVPDEWLKILRERAQRHHRLYAPALLAYELASVARKKTLNYPDQRLGLQEALHVGLRLGMVRVWFE